MSILIKGMDMPKHDDEYVIFTVYGDGGVVYGPLNRPHVRYKNRAVQVPPHGRLIDADALNYTMLYKENWMRGTGVEDLAVWRKDIDAAPTVIPTSEEE